MIAQLVSFALRQRFLIVVASLALVAWGAWSFRNLPIDAYPDLSPPHVELITQWPGHAPEEIERLITIPIEIELNGIPRLESLRSISRYGLSFIAMNFEYGTEPYFVREQAFQRMGNASLPDGLTPSLSPMFSPSGLIYRYVLQSPDRSPQELKTIEDWVLERHYRSIQGVADDSGLGGTTMQYQVLLDPNKLFAYGVSVPSVFQQLSSNNANSGGGFYSQGGQFYYVRGLGLVRNTDDIGNVVVSEKGGIPVYVKNLADVAIGYAPRLGQFGFMHQNEAVEGVILMRVGEQAQAILKRVEAMTQELNEHVLPPDVKVVPYYDRQGLIEETTRTVEANLVRGIVLVLIILGLFLMSVRTALIVAVTIPFALMFSFICLDWRHIPANLLSIGAIDFGIIVDGSVVMVENIFRELAARGGEPHSLMAVIRDAARDVERPIFYAIAVIIAGYLPIYVLSGPSGRLFQPMADTMSFALLGSLLCTLTLLPVLCSYFLRRHVREPQVRVYEWLRDGYGRMLGRCLRQRLVTVAVILAIFGASLLMIPFIGGEFMPHLDEGALWVRATAPYTISFEEASKLSPQIRDILLGFPQVTTVANELGRPDDATDPTGFFNNEFYVGLKPYDDAAWRGQIHDKPALIKAVQKKLAAFPGVIFNFTQPAEDAVDEAETGLKSALAVKIFGSNLSTLEAKAEQTRQILQKIPGITEITVVRELGQPSLIVTPDRAKLARYGLNVSDINTLVGTAIGGQAATQVIQGERQFDLVVRMQEQFRGDENAIRNLLITTPDGQNLPLSQFADVHVESGASFIYREANSRYIGVQFSVEGRDLAGAVGEARRKVEGTVQLASGYKFDWGGEYKDYLLYNLRTAFIQVLQANALLANAKENLDYYDRELVINRQRLQSGDIARLDFNRLVLLRAQYESDLETSQVNARMAKITLLTLLNDRTPVDRFQVTGTFEYSNRFVESLEEYRTIAVDARPDLRAAVQAVDKAQTDHKLAVANGSADPTFGLDVARNPPIPAYIGLSMNIPLRIFDRNQGEKERTAIDIRHAERLRDAARAQVFSDVDSAYFQLLSAVSLLKPYRETYLETATDVRDTMSFSYQRGQAALVDYLDAQRDYRAVRVAYLNLVGSYMQAAAQLSLAMGREIPL